MALLALIDLEARDRTLPGFRGVDLQFCAGFSLFRLLFGGTGTRLLPTVVSQTQYYPIISCQVYPCLQNNSHAAIHMTLSVCTS